MVIWTFIMSIICAFDYNLKARLLLASQKKKKARLLLKSIKHVQFVGPIKKAFVLLPLA